MHNKELQEQVQRDVEKMQQCERDPQERLSWHVQLYNIYASGRRVARLRQSTALHRTTWRRFASFFSNVQHRHATLCHIFIHIIMLHHLRLLLCL